MSKIKLNYVCQNCGVPSPKWMGQCADCGAWNSFTEEAVLPKSSRFQGYAATTSQIMRLSEVHIQHEARMPTGLSELDRVLGGGLVEGSVVLLGGDPGIGKSTVLLQTLCHMQRSIPALYVTGEESLTQVTLRARRLGLGEDLKLLAETSVERIISIAQQELPKIIVIDSIQTVHTENLQSAPGGVGQVRESAGRLVQFAKQTGTALFLVGHVTKEGTLAGPRVLEHMVDTVLYFEGESDSRFRVIRAVKNRFGAVNELGVFAMTDKGLREVSHPSAIFLSHHGESKGSTIMVNWEGSRPLLVEVQALVDTSHLANPRRVTVGLDQNRLAMLLAVLHRHGGVATYDQDVFVNAVGGIRVVEPGADLAIICSVLTSLRQRSLEQDLVVFGEIGLAGEIRPVPSGQERLREAAKHGFKRAIVPKGNAPKVAPEGIEVIAVSKLDEALAVL